MSTRSQIKLKNSPDNIHVYKHSDGYPEGVLPVLVPFVAQFMESRGYDECYILAQLVRRFAVEDYKAEIEFNAKHPNFPRNSSYEFLGWGLDCERHGDIEYLYEIGEDGSIWVNGKQLTKAQLKKYSTKLTKQEGA